MFNFGIESVEYYGDIAYYGAIFLVEFFDYSRCIAIGDGQEGNYVLNQQG